MQMVIGCGRGISGMAKNHIKTIAMCSRMFFQPHITSGTRKTVVPKIPKNSGSTPTPRLHKAVLAQGGGAGTGSKSPYGPCTPAPPVQNLGGAGAGAVARARKAGQCSTVLAVLCHVIRHANRRAA